MSHLVFFIIINEGERDGDVERGGFARVGRAFSGFERHHEIHPSHWVFLAIVFDQVLAKHLL